MIKDYYNQNAKDLYLKTIGIDLHPIYNEFQKYLKIGCKLLDVGFGSGRDSLYFNEQRFHVVSIDFAEEVVKRGKSLLNNEVLLVDVRDIQYKNEFDAIWASAIFLHFTNEEILKILKKCSDALKDDGVMYVSFKYGADEALRKGRYFNNFNEEKWLKLIEQQNDLKVEKMWVTEDARPDRLERYWLNVILKK